MALFPTIPNPTSTIPTTTPTIQDLLKPDLLCDFEQYNFVRDGSGDLAVSTGHRAWVQSWVHRLLLQQAAHAAYPRSVGMNHQRLMRLPTRERIEAEYSGRINRQASREPATRQVRNMRFDWQYDSCSLYMTIICITGDTVPMAVALYG